MTRTITFTFDQRREALESPVHQGEDEEIDYLFDMTNWGTPTSPTVKIYDSQGTDTSSTNLDGDPSVSGDVVTLPTCKVLIAAETYRLECKMTISGNVLEAFIVIHGEE